MEFIFIIENEKGILKNKEGKEIQFETEADALNYIDEHNIKNAVVRMDYAEDAEKEEDSSWNGCCPFCGSCNVDFVDEVDEDTKYIYRCCNEDFLVDAETGKCTDRHRRPIRKEED